MRLKHHPVQHLHVEFLPTPVELPHQQVHAAMQRLRARLGLPWGNKWREVWPVPAVTKIEAVVHSFVHGDVVPNSWGLVQAVQPSGGSYHPPLVHDAHPFIGVRQE